MAHIIFLHILNFICTFLIAGSFVVAKDITDLSSPLNLTIVRFGCSALLMLPLVLLKGVTWKEFFHTIKKSVVISFFFVSYFLLMFESLKTTTSLNTGTIYTLSPIESAILAILFFRERITPKMWVAYVTALIGTLIVIFDGNIDHFLSLKLAIGDLLFVIASFCMCFYSFSMKMLYRGEKQLLLAFCTQVCGALWIGLAMYFYGETPDITIFHGRAFWDMAYLTVLATLVTGVLLQHCSINLGPRIVMAYVYLNPLMICFLQFVLFGSTISVAQTIGTVVCLSSMGILLYRKNGH